MLLNHDGRVYLADFSIAAALPQHLAPLQGGSCEEEDSAMPFAGSICWMAPEVVEGSGYPSVSFDHYRCPS